MKKLSYVEMKSAQEAHQIPIINVLAPEKFAETKIPGAINIPLESEEFTNKIESYIGSKDKEVIVYCASKQCPASKHAAQALDEAGFTNVQCYEGGAKEWQQKSGALQAA